jgi:tetratricopeptide (TPR) repeat protein
MVPIDAVREWISLIDVTARADWIDRQVVFNDDLLRAMKAAADDMLHQSPQRAFGFGKDILEVARRTGSLLHQAWGEMACGNALLFLSRYPEAIARYDSAQALCLQAGSPIEAARSQIGKSYCLMAIATYDEGFAVAASSYETLVAHQSWLFAARAANNAANNLQRQGKIEEAFTFFQKAEDACVRSGEQGLGELLSTNLNRALLQSACDARKSRPRGRASRLSSLRCPRNPGARQN